MSKKPSKKDAILEYVKNNPTAKAPEVAKACGAHQTYTYITMRNAGVKKAKKAKPAKPAAKPDFVFKQKDYEDMMLQAIKDLTAENTSLKDDIVRMSGVIEYLEAKLQHATSI